MHSYAVVVLLAATLFGHGHARATSGVSVFAVFADLINDVTVPECPHKAVPDTDFTVPSIMLNKLKECIEPSAAFNRQLGAAPDKDAYRRLFRSACVQVPAVRTCMAAVDADAPTCLSQTERKMWATVVDYVDECVTATCADDSEVMANMFGDEFKVMTAGNQLRVVSCIYATAAQTLFDRETDLSAYTLRKYRSMKSGKQCILNVAKHGQTSASQFELFMDTTTRKMKCLTPVTNEIVLCETIEAEHVIGDYD